LKKAHLWRNASALAARILLKHAPLTDPRDAWQPNFFEQPAKQWFFNTLSDLIIFRAGNNRKLYKTIFLQAFQISC